MRPDHAISSAATATAITAMLHHPEKKKMMKNIKLEKCGFFSKF